MNNTALVILAIVGTAALVLSILNYIELRDLNKHTINLYSHIQRLDYRTQQPNEPDPGIWEAEEN